MMSSAALIRKRDAYQVNRHIAFNHRQFIHKPRRSYFESSQPMAHQGLSTWTKEELLDPNKKLFFCGANLEKVDGRYKCFICPYNSPDCTYVTRHIKCRHPKFQYNPEIARSEINVSSQQLERCRRSYSRSDRCSTVKISKAEVDSQGGHSDDTSEEQVKVDNLSKCTTGRSSRCSSIRISKTEVDSQRDLSDIVREEEINHDNLDRFANGRISRCVSVKISKAEVVEVESHEDNSNGAHEKRGNCDNLPMGNDVEEQIKRNTRYTGLISGRQPQPMTDRIQPIKRFADVKVDEIYMASPQENPPSPSSRSLLRNMGVGSKESIPQNRRLLDNIDDFEQRLLGSFDLVGHSGTQENYCENNNRDTSSNFANAPSETVFANVFEGIDDLSSNMTDWSAPTENIGRAENLNIDPIQNITWQKESDDITFEKFEDVQRKFTEERMALEESIRKIVYLRDQYASVKKNGETMQTRIHELKISLAKKRQRREQIESLLKELNAWS